MTGSLRCALSRGMRFYCAGAFFALTIASGTLRAADVFWEGDVGGDPLNWATAGNWAGGVLPGGGDNAYINNGRPAQVKSDVGIINEIHVAGGSRLEVVAGGNVLPDGAINIGDVAGQTGELLITGGALDGFTQTLIGINGGTGNARQTGGKLIYSNDTISGSVNAGFYLGRGAGSVGPYNLEGGELIQTTSGSVDNGDSWNHIGHTGGEATFNISGGTASFNSRTHVGFAGEGTINQSGGLFEVRGHELTLGDDIGGVGTYNMTGGQLKVLGTDGGGTLIRDIQVGHWQDTVGRINISGGSIETRDINLANYRGSQGFMDISGTANVQVNGWMRVGAGESEFVGQGLQATTRGHVKQTGGTVNIAGRLLVGDKRTSEGVYDMSAGELHAGDWSFIGGVGEGYADNGTPDNLGDDRLAGAGKGTFNLSGTGLLNIRNRFHVGGENGGQGILNQSGGTLTVEAIRDGGGAITNAPDMLVGDGRKSKGEYNLTGGTATIDRDFLIGHWGNTEGHVTVDGGSLSVGQHMFVGAGTDTEVADIGNDRIAGTADDDYRSPNHGFLTLKSGSVSIANDLVLGDGFTANGQVNVEGGDLTVGQWTYIGRGYLDDAGTIYSSTGEFNVSGGHVEFQARVGIGVNGVGSLNQTGGRIDFTDSKATGIAFHVGDGATGHGEYNLSGGEAIVTGGRVQIGHWHALDATMNVSGTGLLRTTTDVHVGSESDGPANRGILNQSGGTIDVGGNMILAFHPASTGDVNMTDGELHNRNNVFVGDAGLGTFTQTGGVHTIDGDLTMGAQSTADGLYTLDGGVLDMTGGSMSYGAGIGLFAFEGGTLKDAGFVNFNLVNNGGILAPGASPGVTNIVGNYAVTSVNAVYQAEIAGLLQGSEYDLLNVSGTASLGGKLQVLLGSDGPVLGDTNADNLVDLVDLNNVRNNFGSAGLGDTDGDGDVDLTDLNNVRNNFGSGGGAGFIPEIGDSFTVLTATGGVSGTFASTAFPPLPAGRAWGISYLANSVRLNVLATPAPVPEPGTLALGGILLLAGGWWARRQKLS